MAEAYLRLFAGDKASVYSAGTKAQGVNPYTAKVMLEDGIDISGHTSNNVQEYQHLVFDHVLTVCDAAKESCPVFPQAEPVKHHHSFPDPAAASGSEDQILSEFRTVREMVKNYCREFVAHQL